MADNRPLGIYDSGIGGLSVVSEVIRQLPNESFIYYGDTKNLPYGDKKPAQIIEFNKGIFAYLLDQNCKMIVSACNSSSAIALPTLMFLYPALSVVSLIEPGAYSAVKATKNKRIGLIATTATVKSNAYANAVKKINNAIEVQQVACPEFVPIIESGKVNEPETYEIVKKYISQFQDIDTLIYGCTHYPALEPILKQIFPDNKVSFINPAIATVQKAVQEMQELNLAADKDNSVRYEFVWSGQVPGQFNAKSYQPAEKVSS
jgi:glutamate racemase